MLHRFYLIVTALITTAVAQPYTGTVTDSASGAPVESVLVRVRGNTAETYTDASGEFTLAPSAVTDIADRTLPPVLCDPVSGSVSWSGFRNVRVSLFDMNGTRVIPDEALPGVGAWALPPSYVPQVRLLQLDADGMPYRIKSVSNGTGRAVSFGTVSVPRAALTADEDTLFFSKAGYALATLPAGMDMAVTLSPLSTAPTTLQSSVVHRGVTFTFSTAVPVGIFHNGDPFVVSDRPFQITDVNPASGSNGEYVVNGLMVDPFITTAQGFDESMASDACCGASTVVPYSSTENDDPAINGAISVAQGAAHSMVKAKRRSDIGTGSAWGVIEEYVVLTVLPAAPAAGSFRPGMSNAAQKQFAWKNVNWNALRSLPMPADVPDVTTALGYQKRVLPYFGTGIVTGEKLRRLQTDYDLVSNNYSGTIAPFRTLPMYLLHGDVTQAEKEEMAAIIIQHGLDVYADYQKGFTGGAGAGQHHGYHNYLWYAAFLLNDADLLSAAQAMRSNMQSHPQWIPESVLGYGAAFPGPSGQQYRYRETFMHDDIGKPFWTETFRGSNTYARYATITLVIGGIEALPVLLLQDGPGGMDGYEAILHGPGANGRYDTSNDRAAIIAVRDRINTWQDRERSFTQGSTSFYTDWRQYVSLPQWTGTPDQFGGMYTQNFFGAADGGIRWNVTPYRTYSTLPVSEWHVRYGLDEIQFVEVDGQEASGTLTGLIPGAPHYCQLAAENAKGRAKWSPNYPVAAEDGAFSDGPRNVITPTGTPAAASPVRTLDPAIHYKPYPAWKGPHYVPAPTDDTLSADILTLYAGAGYYSGYPAPAFTYQWKRDGADITDADSNAYTLTADDLGTEVSCAVTATNGTGSTVFTTAPVLIRTPAPLPAGIVIDTDFSGRFALDYPDELAAAVTNNVTLIHRPTFLFDDFNDISPGVLHGDKNAAWPSWTLTFIRNITAATTYRVNAETIIGYGTDWNRGDGYFRIYDDASGTTLLDIALIQTEDGTPEAVCIDTVFTTPAGATTLSLKMGVSTSTGATSLGDTYLSELSIIEEN